MSAFDSLDLAYFIVTVVQWLMIAALPCMLLWFAHEYARARRADQRDELRVERPSNVNVLPYTRAFDFELDA